MLGCTLQIQKLKEIVYKNLELDVEDLSVNFKHINTQFKEQKIKIETTYDSLPKVINDIVSCRIDQLMLEKTSTFAK